MLRRGVKLQGKVSSRFTAIGQKRERLRILHALGLQHCLPPLLGFSVVALHEAKLFSRLCSGHRLAHNDLEVMLFLVPVPDIPAVETNGERSREVRPRLAVSQAAARI